ncbi:MAG: carboxypeptidase-like regulatory domain-containing protein [Acidobacteriia bacterium]|nr:carboxypeptidase-like regulatory domain-containing protein [Terriglobia bacterium]
MASLLNGRIRSFCLVALGLLVSTPLALGEASWSGTLRDDAGKPVGGAIVSLRSMAGELGYTATTSAAGEFTLAGIAAGSYRLSASAGGKTWKAADPMVIGDGVSLVAGLQLSSQPPELRVLRAAEGASSQASGGEHLTSGEVSSLLLNKRDFTKLLALAGGTTTDTNGANNFTLQFAINGQRGTTAVFAMDGIYTTDPELGGATFSNFNVDAIQEIQSQSGVMPPEIGAGAAGYTNVVTKSGANQVHGDAFEFLRNASLDARNFFDHRSFVSPGRIPPFQRNEFGFTLGGPVVLPGGGTVLQ